MRTACEQFFAARLPITGLAACGARMPDGMVIHQCFNRWLSPHQVRQAVSHLTQAFELLQQHQLAPTQMAWVFEHLKVHLGLRPDKACLALFLENRPNLPSGEVQAVLQEFASLPIA
jgi:hypothetical protein